MWKAARGLLLLAGRSGVGAKVPAGASWTRATSGVTALSPWVAGGSSQAGVCALACGSVPHATTHRLLHAGIPSPASDSSSELMETEVDRLYSHVEVECRGHEPAVLRSYLKFVTTAAGHLGVPLEEIMHPKKHVKRWTLLKSVHIHKKHRVQYEARTHFLVMRFARLTGSTADTFLEYIQRNLPEGVAMKVTTHEIQKLPQHVKASPEVLA